MEEDSNIDSDWISLPRQTVRASRSTSLWDASPYEHATDRVGIYGDPVAEWFANG